MRVSFLVAALGLVSAVSAQIVTHAHGSVYNGYTRGFNFTSSISFNIVGLDLPLDAFQAGDTASYLVQVNGTNVHYSTGNSGLVAVNIPVLPGDVVDILGNWSPVTTGNFTAHNSYGSNLAGAGAAPFASVIEGVPHTLNRVGWQWDIGDPAYTSGAFLPVTTGSIGRVDVYTATGSGSTLASNTTLGSGCNLAPGVSSYELFGTGGFDLSNTAISFINTGTGYFGITGITTYVPPSASATALTLTDDSEAVVTLSAAMPVGTGSTNTLAVCSNGFISAGSGNGTSFTPTVATFLNGPRAWWSLGWHDMNPTITGSGQVMFEEVSGIAYITYDGVWDFAGTSTENANTMQAQFDLTSGTVHFVYQTMSALGNGHLVGFADAGPSADPGSMDISAAVPNGYQAATFAIVPLTLTASTRPITGTNWNLDVSNIDGAGLIGVDIFGTSDPGVLDLSLFGLGQPGCQLRSELDVINAYVTTGNSNSYSLVLPNNPVLVGFQVFTQSAVLTLPNLALTKTTGGIQGSIGDY